MTTSVSLPVQNIIVTVRANCDLKVEKESEKKSESRKRGT